MRAQPLRKPGDTLEVAIWLDGTETPEHVRRWKEDSVKLLRGTVRGQRVLIGEVRYDIRRPGQSRVPPVPDHIQGPDVRLLIAEADVVAVAFEVVPTSTFIADLDPRDLARLREITRQAYAKNNPGKPRLTDMDCDAVIEAVGPESAAAVVKHAVDGGLVH